MAGINTANYWDMKGAPVRTPFKMQWLITQLMGHLPETGTVKILDVGCATGDLLSDLLERVAEELPKLKVIPCGLDVSPVMITECKKRFKGGEFIAADIIDFMQGNTDVYDFIISCHTMEHFTNVYPITEFLIAHAIERFIMVVPFADNFRCNEHVSFFDMDTYTHMKNCTLYKKGCELDKGMCVGYDFDARWTDGLQ